MAFQKAVEKLEGLIGKYTPKKVKESYIANRFHNQLGNPNNTSIIGFSPLEILTAIPTAAIVALSPSVVHADEVYGPDALVIIGNYGGRATMDFKGHQEAVSKDAPRSILGIRYGVNKDSNIVSPANGHVLFLDEPLSEANNGAVWLDHGNGYLSLIFHLGEVNKFKPELYVGRGQSIGKSGVQRRSRGKQTTFLYSYSQAFLRANEKGEIKWLDPDKHGEEGGRPKVYDGKQIQDNLPLEQKIFYKDVLNVLRNNLKDAQMPAEMNNYFNKSLDNDIFSLTQPWVFDLSKTREMLKKYENSFKPGTAEEYSQKVNKMMDPGLKPIVVLTHTYGKSK